MSKHHKLNKIGQIGEGSNTYSIFENPDKDLVEKIKAVQRPETFTHYRYSGSRVEQQLPSGQLLCVDEDGVYFIIEQKDYQEATVRTYMLRINELYPVSEYFTKAFGPIDFIQSRLHEITDMISNTTHIPRNINFYDGVHSVSLIESWSYFDYHDYIWFENNIGLANAHIYFNEDGNYVNRDYNQTLISDREFISKEATIENLLALFDKYETLEYANGKWFTPEFCFHISDRDERGKIYIFKEPQRGLDRYFRRGVTPIKKPKTVEVVGPEHIKDVLRGMIKYEYLDKEFKAKWEEAKKKGVKK